MNLKLRLGIDLANPLGPTPYLAPGNQIRVDARIDESGVGFESLLGVFAAEFTGGSVIVDGDGMPGGTDTTAYTAQLNPIAGDRHYLSDPLVTRNAYDVDGIAQIQLPVSFPSLSGVPSQPNFVINYVDGAATQLHGPNIEALASTFDLDSSLNAASLAFQNVFASVQNQIDEQIFRSDFPLIGNSLLDHVNFLDSIQTSIANNFAELSDTPTMSDLRVKLFEALGPTGLAMLIDANSDGEITVDDVVMTDTPNSKLFDLSLHQELLPIGADIPFETGLPGLPLNVDANVDLSLGFDLEFGIGLDENLGFFLDFSAADDLQIELDAKLAAGSYRGTLGFLPTEVDVPDTTMSGTLAVQITDPSFDHKLTLLETLGSNVDLVAGTFDADPSYQFDIRVDFGESGDSVEGPSSHQNCIRCRLGPVPSRR